MREDGQIDYIEFPGMEMAAVKAFYEKAFRWAFTDFGSAYAAFDQGLEGGFTTDADTRPGAPLVVLWADDLEAMLEKVTAAGGRVTLPIFTFPGGRRFHFADPSGNELAVWTAVA